MPGLETDEASPGIDVDVAAVQEREEYDSAVILSDSPDPFVRAFVNILSVKIDISKDLGQEPFQVAGRCGTAFEDHPEARNIVDGRHEQLFIDDRGPADVFVDAPGPRDDAHFFFIRQPAGNGRGMDVHAASCNRRSGSQSGLCGYLFGDRTADLARVFQRRKLVVNHFQSHIGKELSVVADVTDVHQARTGHICNFTISVARQFITDIVLAHKDIFRIFNNLRLVVEKPVQDRGRLAFPAGLHRFRQNFLKGSVLLPPNSRFLTAGVGGDDPVIGLTVVVSHQIQAVAVAGNRHRDDLVSADPRLLQQPPDRILVGLPHFFAVPFRKTGFRLDHVRFASDDGDLRPVQIVQSRFAHCSPVVQTKQILFHNVSPLMIFNTKKVLFNKPAGIPMD